MSVVRAHGRERMGRKCESGIDGPRVSMAQLIHDDPILDPFDSAAAHGQETGFGLLQSRPDGAPQDDLVR